MGEKDVRRFDTEQRRVFTNKILRDVEALEQMLASGAIESGVRRIGVEQEMFLVDENWHPASKAIEVLERVDDPRVTHELALFNLEFNLDPIPFGGGCLRRLEAELASLLETVEQAAAEVGARIVLTGILPTLQKSDLTLENMTPEERYFALSAALDHLRGGTYKFYLKGVDELLVEHETMMLEAANTSFQVHFQVGAAEFARLYNIALVAAAPALAVAAGSPLLFGKRLWRETRIALFQQSIDTRSARPDMRDIKPRVHFGTHWVEDSVLEIFREDISRFRVLIGAEIEEDPLEELRQGRVPSLKALQLHNSTVYRWNRPCYGISDGKPHLRIESRVLASGPTPLDEVANAAFWFGLVSALAHEERDVRDGMDFDDALGNFVAAARLGLDSHLMWLDVDHTQSARRLVLERILPLAREGLRAGKVDEEDIERYLGIIEERVASKQTPAQWMLRSLARMKERGSLPERLNALTAAIADRAQTGQPVHRWPLAEFHEAGDWKPSYQRIEQYMTTDLITVGEDEPIDLVARLMDWHRIHHIPVEDERHRLLGLVSHRSLLRFLASGGRGEEEAPTPVSDVMQRELITVQPDTPTLEAIELMKDNRIGCLPVTAKGRLVGIVTEHDFLRVAGLLLEQRLRE
ncbi:MAG: CBS domain-containing protein [Gemmatimonadetes bacterium]|nr:CBS domain-containing protein [Gemmatimonadota bacterium]